MAPKRIAVIGGGPSGLTAIKSCKEVDLDVVCFERNGEPGGLWRYHDEDLNGVASVMKTTVINTSKEISAFSDYPPPADLPNFMHHSKMYEYFMGYAKKFDLLKHFKYYEEVVEVIPTEEHEKTGQWIVTTKNSKTNEKSKSSFDGVMVCIGHHVFPKIPTFPGQEKFKGRTMHTHSLKNCEQFSGQKVIVVGIGNSGVDAAVDSAFVAKNVYLSTRRGSWIFTRVGKNGRPYDMDFLSRWTLYLQKFSSFEKSCDRVEANLNKHFDHEAYNLKPEHRVFSAHPTMNDSLPNCILSGRIMVKGNVDRFEENGVVFEGENDVTEANVVIFATGYEIKFPFLSDDILTTEDNRIRLYKYCIPPNLKKPTLAIIALIQPLGPIFPIAEMQCRWFMQIFKGKLKLPNWEIMEKDIRHKNKCNRERYVDSTRHTIQVDFLPMLDELSSMMGCKPDLHQLAFSDPALWWLLLTGPPMPYQFRITGPHKWDGARNAILNYEERIYTPLNTRSKHRAVHTKPFVFPFAWVFLSLVVLVLGYLIFRLLH